MSGVRVLVGTRKDACVLTSDAMRKQWEITGPHFPGSEIFHVDGSRDDTERLYASQYSAWFGQLIQHSDDGGKTWGPVGNKFLYDGVPGTHEWYDGTPHPWELKRVWHLEPKERAHICAFFNSLDEGHRVLLPFFKEGLELGQKVLHTN